MTARRGVGAEPEADPPPPRGLRGAAFPLLGPDYAVISYPISSEGTALFNRLTRAERAVAEALAMGAPYAAIAAERGTSRRTVRNQVTSIFKKLGVSSRVELAAYLSRYP